VTAVVVSIPSVALASPSSSAQAATCGRPRGVPTTARQAVVVEASGTTAQVQLRVHDGTRWVCTRVGMDARVGRNGIRPLEVRVAGDGTTPAGVFPLATMTAPDGQRFQFFGNGVNPGVKGTWRAVRAGDCWDTSGGDPTYNTLTHRSAASCGSPAVMRALRPGEAYFVIRS